MRGVRALHGDQEAWQRAGADPDERPRTYFKLSPVFDRSQVEPLPPPAEPVPLDPPGLRDVDGDELALWKPALEQLAGELGSTVSYEPIPGSASGSYDLETRAIRVDPGRPTNAQVKTLIHELAHALVRADRQDDDPELDRAAEELVAETVAYSVCASGRIDTGDYSITYLASWAETAPADTLERTAALIDRLARRIEDAVADVDHAEQTDEEP